MMVISAAVTSVKLSIGLSFVIVFLVMIFLGFAQAFGLLMCSLLVHESAHLVMAKIFRVQVETVKLSALGAAARVRNIESIRLWKRYFVYLSGPVANALIALLALALSMVYSRHHNVLYELAMLNIVLCVFNLLPVFPLDGGRIFQNFLCNRMGLIRSNRVILRVGRVLGALLIFLGLVQVVLFPYNFTLLLAGVYLGRRANDMGPSLTLEALRALEAKNAQPSKPFPVKLIILRKKMPVYDAVEYLGLDFWGVFQIEGGGYITEWEVLRCINQ